MPKQTEQQKIDWFNKLRLNSWEVEILIVGFVLVMMFQIPEYIDYMIDKVKFSLSQNTIFELSNWIGKVSSLFVIKLCINILIISFTIYLGLRGFWVGLIGFSSVYPNGINIKKLNYNKVFSDPLEKINFNNYIIKIDNACSMIFSFSFFFSFQIISLLLFAIQVLILLSCMAFLSDSFPDQSFYLEEIGYYIFLTHLLLGSIYFLDHSASYFKRIKWKPFAVFYNFIDIFFTYTTLIFIYKPLYYAMVSNIKQRVILGIATIIPLCYAIGNFFISNVDFIYFPYENTQNHMKNIYYENKFEDLDIEYVFPQDPFINADIITDGYLKLYVPYSPRSNIFYKQNCSNIDDINYESATPDKEKIVLDCINKFYNITIDDKNIKSDFIFYRYSKSGVEMKTFFMPIILQNLKNGKHIITVKEMFNRDKNIALNENASLIEVERDGKTYIIPFYIFKD
tara:strand:+ start:827 stop:2188 length:1362 start_codon:yes stop_codon:yes gene_type:complete